MLFLLALKWNLYENTFSVLKQKATQILLENLLKEGTIIFTVNLMNHIFQTSELFNIW